MRAFTLFRALVRRLPWVIVTVWGVSTFVFFASRVNGNPIALMSPPQATPAQIAAATASFGLDKPLLVQYFHFLHGIGTGSFGESYFWQRPAFGLVLGRLGPTFLLAVVAIVGSILVAVPLGLLAGFRPYRRIDKAGRFLSTVGQSIPVFWLAPLLVMVFAVRIRLFPASGMEGSKSIVLPALSLMLFEIGLLFRIVRSSAIEALSQDSTRLVRAKGVGDVRLALTHILPNISGPLLTIIGLDMARLLGGSVIVETFFAWPGIGQLLIQAAENRDYPVLQSLVVIFAVSVVIINMIVDTANEAVDPRTRAAT